MKKWVPKKYEIILAVALSLSLLGRAGTLLWPGRAALPVDWARTVSRPFAQLWAECTGQIAQVTERLAGQKALQAENEALRLALAQAEQDRWEGAQAQQENARLRSLLGLRARDQALRLEAAWVTGRPAESWQTGLYLNKGRAQGVTVGDSVIDETGALMGRVAETGESWCRLRLVTDTACQLAGQAPQSGTTGVLAGDWGLMARGQLRLSGLSPQALLVPGEMVVTFGTQGAYPSGLPVGRVEEIALDAGGLTKSAVLSPAADLSQLGEVFVVTAFSEELG